MWMVEWSFYRIRSLSKRPCHRNPSCRAAEAERNRSRVVKHTTCFFWPASVAPQKHCFDIAFEIWGGAAEAVKLCSHDVFFIGFHRAMVSAPRSDFAKPQFFSTFMFSAAKPMITAITIKSIVFTTFLNTFTFLTFQGECGGWVRGLFRVSAGVSAASN